MPKAFPPLIGENPKIIILGSMPGEASLRAGQYYAHPSNRFFKIMFAYFGEQYTADYQTRTRLLIDNGIALWDSIEFCEREGSMDSDIKNPVFRDVDGLIKEHPTVRAVFTNGKASAKYYLAANSFRPHINLPSTSPANCAVKNLYDIWKEALCKYLK